MTIACTCVGHMCVCVCVHALQGPHPLPLQCHAEGRSLRTNHHTEKKDREKWQFFFGKHILMPGLFFLPSSFLGGNSCLFYTWTSWIISSANLNFIIVSDWTCIKLVTDEVSNCPDDDAGQRMDSFSFRCLNPNSEI